MAEILASYPEILALVIMLAGWLLARVARRMVAMGIGAINRLVGRLGSQDAILISDRVDVAAQIVTFWVVLLVAVVLALRVLGIDELAVWLDGAIAFVPKIVLSAAILSGGHVVGLMLRNLVLGTGVQDETRMLMSKALYGLVMVLASVTALQHVGLDISFVVQVALILIAAFLSGMALAFAFGARQLIANLTARGEFERYELGEHIRIGAVQGVLVEKHRTGVVIATEAGLVSVPGANFARREVLRLPPEETT